MPAQTKTIFEDFFTDDGEKSLEKFGGSFLPDPDQAFDVKIDLVNQRQASIWPSTRCSMPQVTTCSTASKTLVPGSAKRFGSFLPRKPARPTG